MHSDCRKLSSDNVLIRVIAIKHEKPATQFENNKIEIRKSKFAGYTDQNTQRFLRLFCKCNLPTLLCNLPSNNWSHSVYHFKIIDVTVHVLAIHLCTVTFKRDERIYRKFK